MSRKQVRIDNQDQMRTGLPDLLRRQIHVVLFDSTVRFGKLERADDVKLVLSNMRLKTIHIPIESIFEIYTDVKP